MSHPYSILHSPASRAGLFLLALTLLVPVLAGCGTQAQNALKVQENLSEALRLAQVEPTDTKARQSADQAIAIAPHDPATYLGPRTRNSNDLLPQISIADVFSSVGDNPALADYMTQAVQKFPTDERGYINLAQTQGQLGQTAAQKATAAQLVTLLNTKLGTPGTTDIRELTTELGQAYFDSGDTADGIATYKKAIQAYPTEPAPVNNLAYAYAVSRTHLPEALILAHQAITLAQKKGVPEEEIAEYTDTLGWVQCQQGQYAEAEQNLLQAANVLPRFSEVRYHLGLVYIAESKMDAARAELGHAVLLTQGYAAAEQALKTLPKAAPSQPTVAAPKPTVAAAS